MPFISVWINGWDVWRWLDPMVLASPKGKFDKLVMYWESAGPWGGGWEFCSYLLFYVGVVMWRGVAQGLGGGLHFSVWLVFGTLLSCLSPLINKDGSHCLGNIPEIRVHCMHFYFPLLDKKTKKKRAFLTRYVIITPYNGVLCYFFL